MRTVGPASGSVEHAISRRFVIVGILFGVPASAFFLVLATRGLEPRQVIDAVRRTRLAELLLAVACIGAVYALQAMRWRRIAAAAGMQLPWRSMLRMVISGIAVNNAVPGRAGDLLRSYWLSRDSGGRGGPALSTVVVDRAADLLALTVALLVSYPFVPHPVWSQHVVELAVPAGALIVAVLAGARLYANASTPGRRRLTRLRSHWLGLQLVQGVRGAAATVSSRDLPAIACLSVMAWGAFAVAAWQVARSMGIPVSLPEIVFTTAVVNLGVAIPSAPGFVGSYQWLCVASLGLFAVARPTALAFSIVLQATWFVPTTLIGLGLLLRNAGHWSLRRGVRRAAPAAGPGAR